MAVVEQHVHGPECRCLFEPCVAWWRHWHGGFPGGCDDPNDPDGPPRIFDADDPDGMAVVVDISTDDARFMLHYALRQRRRARLRCVAGHDWRHNLSFHLGEWWSCKRCSLIVDNLPGADEP